MARPTTPSSGMGDGSPGPVGSQASSSPSSAGSDNQTLTRSKLEDSIFTPEKKSSDSPPTPLEDGLKHFDGSRVPKSTGYRLHGPSGLQAGQKKETSIVSLGSPQRKIKPATGSLRKVSAKTQGVVNSGPRPTDLEKTKTSLREAKFHVPGQEDEEAVRSKLAQADRRRSDRPT